MSYWGYKPYVSVAQRRANAAKLVRQLLKAGQTVSPVVIEGRRIAASFWGKAWCDNLERYSDFSNRLPRGRTYVRNGSVVDLSIAEGRVEALVSGSQIYKVHISIAAATPQRWRAICADCTGSIGSIVELLQGKLAKKVMERVCREGDGLFPSPQEIKLACTCPDWAEMCKHVAAVLYGIGARFDANPDELFTLRGVDRNELIAIGVDPSITETITTERVLADDDLAALFGLELDVPLPSTANAQGQSTMPKASLEQRPASKSDTAQKVRETGGKIKSQRRVAKPEKHKRGPLPTTPQEGVGSKQPLGIHQIVKSPAKDQGEARQAAVDTQKLAPRIKPREVAAHTGRLPVRLSVRKKLAEASRGERRGRPR